MHNDSPQLQIYAVDIGSEKKGRLAWCRLSSHADTEVTAGTSLAALANLLKADLRDRHPIAIGFECPLAIDLRDDPAELTSARTGEGNRAWCAGAGSGALAVGLAQCAWLFEQLAGVAEPVRLTFCWAELESGKANFLVWEAFVSNKQAGHTHTGDALAAARAFQQGTVIDGGPPSSISFKKPYSLAGAALLRAGLSTDLALLRQPCLVVRP
ncbi:hypothetical protein K2Z83_24510 [Oscillochloris sp. ZM17-4]|uniref:hypothetical protein n=1 Tax=Oscillochloris sp. ZM17-4 TaxID=2866714 RepID=UPI001C72EECA|nr:hypothetical protein [Oscillochloris sp. ZM17-4]MBX0330825.1 hypothetical protein [Oscillochloris sp. ZM17-4]